jgi:hypothetical protein
VKRLPVYRILERSCFFSLIEDGPRSDQVNAVSSGRRPFPRSIGGRRKMWARFGSDAPGAACALQKDTLRDAS